MACALSLSPRVPYPTDKAALHGSCHRPPLRVARGTQNKVLDAMGRPVVASPPAHDDIHGEMPRDLLVAGDPDGLARAVSGILAARHPGPGAARRAAVDRAYAWPATLRRLDDLISIPHAAVSR